MVSSPELRTFLRCLISFGSLIPVGNMVFEDFPFLYQATRLPAPMLKMKVEGEAYRGIEVSIRRGFASLLLKVNVVFKFTRVRFDLNVYVWNANYSGGGDGI